MIYDSTVLTIDKQDILVCKFQGHSIKLPTDVLLPHLLPRHDEGPTNVTVFDEPFAIRQSKFLSKIKSRDAGSIWDLLCLSTEHDTRN